MKTQNILCCDINVVGGVNQPAIKLLSTSSRIISEAYAMLYEGIGSREIEIDGLRCTIATDQQRVEHESLDIIGYRFMAEVFGKQRSYVLNMFLREMEPADLIDKKIRCREAAPRKMQLMTKAVEEMMDDFL